MIPSPSLARLALPLLAAGLAVGLTGCGRKADPELPVIERKAEPRPVGIPIGPTPIETPAPAQPKPKTPFFLDVLL